jgi:ribonuclease Z
MSCGINPLKINAVFISHLHGDHVYGLFGLISTLGLTGRRTPFRAAAVRRDPGGPPALFRYGVAV